MPEEIKAPGQDSPHRVHQQTVAQGDVVEIKCVRCGDAGLDARVFDAQQHKKPEQKSAATAASINVPNETFGATALRPVQPRCAQPAWFTLDRGHAENTRNILRRLLASHSSRVSSISLEFLTTACGSRCLPRLLTVQNGLTWDKVPAAFRFSTSSQNSREHRSMF